MKQPSDKDYSVAVIGAGAMGQGIAQVAAMGGMRTIVFDSQRAARGAAKERIVARLERLAEKGSISAAEAKKMAGRLEVADELGGIAPADAVIEAVIEDAEIKKDLFRRIEDIVRPETIIASNTSSIPIASIARDCNHKGRIAGMHFFNPVPVMKLVEVIRGPETDAQVVEILSEIGRRMGRTPVTVKDAPGFLVNFGGRAYTTEGLRIVHEGVATPAQVDAVMREACGFRMGPFELMDLTGMDVNYPATMEIYAGYLHDPRLATTPLHKALFDAGRYGRKTGAGHFTYDAKGAKVDPPSPDFDVQATPASRVCLAEADDRLRRFCADVGLKVLPDATEDVPLLAAPLGEDCTHLAVRTGADFRRLVAIDLSADTGSRVTLMTAPGVQQVQLEAVAAALVRAGRKVTVIADSPGFIAQRMRAMIANYGCVMAEIGLAAPEDIDLAMKLGLNYPLGPLEIVEQLGARDTLAIMERLQAITGEDRYRPALWLKRRALLGLDISTPARAGS